VVALAGRVVPGSRQLGEVRRQGQQAGQDVRAAAEAVEHRSAQLSCGEPEVDDLVLWAGRRSRPLQQVPATDERDDRPSGPSLFQPRSRFYILCVRCMWHASCAWLLPRSSLQV